MQTKTNDMSINTDQIRDGNENQEKATEMEARANREYFRQLVKERSILKALIRLDPDRYSDLLTPRVQNIKKIVNREYSYGKMHNEEFNHLRNSAIDSLSDDLRELERDEHQHNPSH